MAERLVVVGGDAAGMSAASQAKRLRPQMEVVALEKGVHTSYSACGIPYVVAGDVDSFDDLVVRTPQEFRDRQMIDVRTRSEVVAADFDRRSLEVRDHEHDRTYHLGFDQLVVATGGRPVRPALPGIDLPHVLGVQTLADGEALLARAESIEGQPVVVVGGGYIGLEVAEALLRRGADVTVVEGGPEVMRTLDADMGSMVRKAMSRMGIKVRIGVRVEGFTKREVLTGAGPLPASLVVLGIGVEANAELFAAAGLEVGDRGALVVDRRQATKVEGVWAAGDCALSHHLVMGHAVHIALGTVANKQGRVAGTNVGGGYATFGGVVGTAVTKVCSLEVARTGLTEREAAEEGFGAVAATIESTTRAGYFPGAAPITVKLVAERGSRRLLGAQIVGEEGAAKRIDVMATALHARMTVDDVVDLDLSYAPPFSSVWDPVQVAARAAQRALE